MEKETSIDEVMEFLQDNMVTKQELGEFRSEIRQEIDEFQQEFNEFRTETRDEFRLIHSELEAIKKRLDILEKRTIEDADVAVRDVLELRRRVEYLEKQVKQLQIAH